MLLNFSKYQGAGNDFILIDARNSSYNWPAQSDLVQQLCDRRFGIGADGLMLLKNKADFDFEMIYYNADGALSSMCGNGGRCIVAFARDLNIIHQKTCFLASDGIHHASFEKDAISLQMIDVTQISVHNPNTFVLNTGSPHYVSFVNNIQDIEVFNLGKTIRYHTDFAPAGINVNFVEENDGTLWVRTYERGVENETYACGTGATAAAIAYAYQNNCYHEVEIPVKVVGGNLRIKFVHPTEQEFKNIFLIGPAQKVFEGSITV